MKRAAYAAAMVAAFWSCLADPAYSVAQLAQSAFIERPSGNSLKS